MASRSVNKVILIGHLGRDAETRVTAGGTARTTFPLATSRRWKDQQTGEWKEETEWHNIVLWRREAVANYLLKGQQVYVEGRIQTRAYDDRDGNKRYVTEIVADDVVLLGSRGEVAEEAGEPPPRSRAAAAPPQPATPGPFEAEISDDDVPF